MSVLVYPEWEGMTQADLAGQDVDDPGLYNEARPPRFQGQAFARGFATGQRGFLHDFDGGTPTARLLWDYHTKKPKPKRVKTLWDRLPAAMHRLFELVEDYQDPDEDLNTSGVMYRMGLYIGFCAKVQELEAAGLEPRVRLTAP